MMSKGDNIAISREDHEQTANDLACAIAANKRYAEELASLRAALEAREGENDRLFDLVRYCRGTLHEEGLITDEEYARIVDEGATYNKGSVPRLHTYDQLRAENAELKKENERLVRLERDARVSLGEAVGDRIDCTNECHQLRKNVKSISERHNNLSAENAELRERVEAAKWFMRERLELMRMAVDDDEPFDPEYPPVTKQELNAVVLFDASVSAYLNGGFGPYRPNNEESDERAT